LKKTLHSIKILFVSIISFVLVIFLILLWQFQQSKPVTSGQKFFKGLESEASIVRDAHGVPHIFGKTANDIYFAEGYAQAQDRFFQMDLTRRLMQGRLSELIGEKTLKIDVQNRIRGFKYVAETMLQELTPEVRQNLNAFSNGVNARIMEGHLAPEYALLMASPEAWGPADSLAVALAMTDNLVVGYEREVARAQLLVSLTPEQVDQFFLTYPNWAPRSIEKAETPLNGSNAWAVSGRFTESGHPLLANDPHLSLTSPGSFYLTHLALPDGDVVGAVLPGEPFIVIGHNKNLAWTNTTNPIDGEDLIKEPAGGFKDVVESTEVIKVRKALFFSREEKITVRRTPQGPVLDNTWFELSMFKTPVVLRSIALDPHNTVVMAMLNMSKANNAQEFIKASEAWHAPTTIVLFASTQDDIGLISTGKIPLRNKQDQWSDFIPWKDQPTFLNPKSGYIATANNLVTPDSYKYNMAGTYSIYRHLRIQEELKSRFEKKVNVSSMMQLQTDVVSVFARRVLPMLLKAQPATIAGQQALALLKEWKADMSADKAQPLIFAEWIKELSKAIYQDELQDLFEKFQGPRADFLETVLSGDLSSWCDNKKTEKIETCQDLAGPALDAAVAEAQKTYGADLAAWRWGAAHKALFKHPLLTGAPLFDPLFTVRAPIGGDADSIFAAAYNYKTGFSAVHGPGMRVVYDLADLQKTQFVMAPGQSAHPWSAHFSDLVPLWAQGQGFELRTDWNLLNLPQGTDVLLLKPEN
jgi:penicillin G amidase